MRRAEWDRIWILSGTLKLREDSREGLLQVHARIADGWHIYALSQKGGPGPSSITVQSADKIQLLGAFQPDEAPEVREVAEFDVPLEEHYGQVTWTAPIRLAEGVDPQTVVLDVLFDGILCHDEKGCIPAMDVPVAIRFEGILDAEQATAMPKTGEFRADRSHVTIRGHVQPASVQPGGVLRLVLTAVCDDDWHIYAYARGGSERGRQADVGGADRAVRVDAGRSAGSDEPIVKQDGDQPPVAYHGGTVSWTFDIQVPEAMPAGTSSWPE
jgi:hypothetical protein